MKEEQHSDKSDPRYPDLEHLWEFAGQDLDAGDFNSAMVHFYRAEVSRSNTWRQRLDNTTNWAVITTGAALTFSFGAPLNTHVVIIIDTLLVLLFLFIEARRYRYYELWTYRVRLMETNYFVGLLSPPYRPASDWATKVTQSLQHPSFPISLGEALGRRYRRNYVFIFLVLAASWILKVLIHPQPATSLQMFLEQARAGPIPGWIVILLGIIFNLALLLGGLVTASMQETTAEVLAESTGGNFVSRLLRRVRNVVWEIFEMELPRFSVLPSGGKSKQMAYIITDEAEVVSRAVFDELGRGVTRLQGQGMYTGEEHGVLICAFDARQAETLQKAVKRADPDAFVIVIGVRDVRGAGFRPLEA